MPVSALIAVCPCGCPLGCPVLHKSWTNTPKMKYASILYIKIRYNKLQSFPTPFTISTEHLKYTKEILWNTKENISQSDLSVFTPKNICKCDLG